MKTLKDFDTNYIVSLEKTFEELEKSYKNISNKYTFDLKKTEITEVILERLKAYYLTQNKVKKLLEKRYLTAASDFFVETVLFYIRLYLKSQGGYLAAHSEKQIKRTKNSIRPDISIWNQEEVVAIIECKTQLGWNRNNWEEQYDERDVKLKIDFPNAKSFLLVMTGLNWGGFGNNKRLNEKYFSLLNDETWPTGFTSTKQILTPIEGLLRQLLIEEKNNNFNVDDANTT